MHPTILAKRKAEAVAKLVFTSQALAESMELDPALVTALHPVGIRDPKIREMMLLEAAGDLLMAVAVQAGAIQEGMSVSTETPEPVAEDAAPEDAQTESEQAEVTAEAEFLSPETAEEPEPEETPADEPEEPEAEPAAPKKSSRKRTKK